MKTLKLNPYHYETFARWLDEKRHPQWFLDSITENTIEDGDYTISLSDSDVRYLNFFCSFPFVIERI